MTNTCSNARDALDHHRPGPPGTDPRRPLCGRPADHPRRARAQPQGRLDRPAARLAHRLHRPLRQRQVLAGLRHDLRRGPAPLRRVALGVRPPVPRPDGQARRRLHRGPVPGGLHRPEVDLAQPALDGRHHHRGLRLPPPALRPCRPATLPDVRRQDRAADAAADRRPCPDAGGGAPLPGARPGHPRPQGRVRRALQPAPDAGLLPGARRRRDPLAGRPADAGQEAQAHHRGGRRPARGQGVRQAPAHRLRRDRADPVGRPGRARLRRPPRGRRAPRDAVQREDGLPQRPHHRRRRARAPLVLLQLPVRRVPGLHRSGHPDGGRRRAGRPQPLGDARRGRHPAVVARPRQRLLPAAAGCPGRRGRVRPQHALGGAPGQSAALDPRRARQQGPRRHPQPLRP